MYPTTSLTTTPTSLKMDLNFFCKFFDLSQGLQAELSDPTIAELLKALEEAGYTIDEQNVVFGPKFGVNWPCLKMSGCSSLNIGIVTGKRGTNGIGFHSLSEYLKKKKQEAEAQANSQTVSIATTPVFQEISASQAPQISNLLDFLSDPPAKNFLESYRELEFKPLSVLKQLNTVDNPIPKNFLESYRELEFKPLSVLKQLNTLDNPIPKNFLLGFQKKNFTQFSVSENSSLSLEDLQRFVAFPSSPPAAVNSFTLEQFYEAKLSIFEGEKYLIIKAGEILVCSKGINILPQERFGDIVLYRNKRGELSDNPSENSPKLKTTLDNREKLEKILPYLNGIPPYQP